jgi:hypothetical protein
MLAARWISSDDENKPLFTRKNLKDLLPETSAFLKDLFDKLVNSNFDKNLSWLLDDITSLLAHKHGAGLSGRKRPVDPFLGTLTRPAGPQGSGVLHARQVVPSCGRRTSLQTTSVFRSASPHGDVGGLRQANNLKGARGVDQAPFVEESIRRSARALLLRVR